MLRLEAAELAQAVAAGAASLRELQAAAASLQEALQEAKQRHAAAEVGLSFLLYVLFIFFFRHVRVIYSKFIA